MRLTSVLQGRPEVAAIEVDLSGPDEELERPMLGAHADRAAEIVGAVARMSLVPVVREAARARAGRRAIARAVVRAGRTGSR